MSQTVHRIPRYSRSPPDLCSHLLFSAGLSPNSLSTGATPKSLVPSDLLSLLRGDVECVCVFAVCPATGI